MSVIIAWSDVPNITAAGTAEQFLAGAVAEDREVVLGLLRGLSEEDAWKLARLAIAAHTNRDLGSFLAERGLSRTH